MNYNASKFLNFDISRDMILQGNTRPSVVNIHTDKKIKRKGAGGETVSIVIEPEDKLYSIPFFKRRRLGDKTSVPFGYK